MTICVICANAVTIYLLMDGTGEIIPLLHLAESLFLLFYSAELIVRFFSFALKKSCLQDFWFKYDMVLVIAMWLEVVLMVLGLLNEIEKLPGIGEVVRLDRFVLEAWSVNFTTPKSDRFVLGRIG